VHEYADAKGIVVVGALLRFIASILGLALLVGGTVFGIMGFWGVTRGSPDAWKLAISGVGAAIVGGAMVVKAPRRY